MSAEEVRLSIGLSVSRLCDFCFFVSLFALFLPFFLLFPFLFPSFLLASPPLSSSVHTFPSTFPGSQSPSQCSHTALRCWWRTTHVRCRPQFCFKAACTSSQDTFASHATCSVTVNRSKSTSTRSWTLKRYGCGAELTRVTSVRFCDDSALSSPCSPGQDRAHHTKRHQDPHAKPQVYLHVIHLSVPPPPSLSTPHMLEPSIFCLHPSYLTLR